MNCSPPIRWVLLLLCVVLWLAPMTCARSQPVNCTITTVPNLVLGTYDAANGSSATSAVAWSCTNPDNQTARVTLCINIGAGSGGVQGGTRLLSDGAGHTLAFQLYKSALPNSAQIWGSPETPSWTNFQTTVPALSTRGGNIAAGATVYGNAPALQITNVAAGTYASTFTSSSALVYSYLQSGVGNAVWPASCTSAPSINVPMAFTVIATVDSGCSVSATTLDFGSLMGFLSTNVDATSTVQLTCPSGVPYQIGLTNGLNGPRATRRMAGGSSEFVNYELYRDSNRIQRWGNIVNSDTVSGTGNGASQSATVYGRIAPQSTPSPSDYADTITVNVVY